jgi:phenylacetate-CoA ligase
MMVNEDIILEIVRPGTGDPVRDGEVGEIVVTTLAPHHPMIRPALGDLTVALPGTSPCGRTNRRIRGWMGRADQIARVRACSSGPNRLLRSRGAIRPWW